ncbi:Putative ATPase OS=Singulisphaera acidiphila (strain ATCC BAA-1392 / DSM 18658 / VKM B-2454 / MOB10) GN=Sinac_6989 PE=4 SV=1: AAA_16: AAA_10 [Gemmataceae bacterium]|nr:Putative ATPase OS=Singulisphaera acidiphila (strain ATCC BAA-1392 / DSM 18658 / VKM B-2454 / MOB10) GN=Sinac_6989 PE=4 SV=1: AAA_16: AAA_10 [Gemmataceae bacterium]VTT99644.1 Putative ATPase OS=Singulisphaera acidiphila (strain ATCC BAA-1392 / DSM 18658 / VKM B-2454 / MOB10) GN=Sinac_6989 PE=4 SV=1: AAA_16: AAA_10 [Gemmataceae bacterium]
MSPAVAAPAVAVPPAVDPLTAAYCTDGGPEVFSGIVHGAQIWTPDPLDVEAVHPEARAAFHRLLSRASGGELPPSGRSLLLLGEGGSGKTHLMRAFRTAAHETGAGYCGYLQMLTRSDNYARYVLSYLIDSLEQPYRPGDATTGLARLARGVLDALTALPEEERRRLSDDLLEPEPAAQLVFRFADVAVQDTRFAGVDLNLLRAVLFLIPDDGRIRPKVLSWLRCEDLAPYDRKALGDLVPRPGPEAPLRTVVELGKLMHAVHSAALVLLVDQMEGMIEQARTDTHPGELFRTAVNALVDIADQLPNAVVVVGCIDDYYKDGRAMLPGTRLDRLERDPEPVQLVSKRSADEVQAIVAQRLEVLFDAKKVPTDPANPLAPFTAGHLAPVTGLRTRDVLDYFRRHRDDCIEAGGWIEPGGSVLVPPPPPPPADFAQLWNDFLPTVRPTIDNESHLAELLEWSVSTLADEMPHDTVFSCDQDERFVQVEVQTGDAVDRLLLALCDKNARGGGMAKQVEEVVKRAGEIPAVFLRSTEFPSSPGADITKRLGKVCRPGGRHRKVVVANTDWKAMAAFREFAHSHHAKPGFREWRRTDRPLAGLHRSARSSTSTRSRPPGSEAAAAVPPPPPAGPRSRPRWPPRRPAAPPPALATVSVTVRFGVTRSASPVTVEVVPKQLCRHAAFIGGPGSGKTTAALSVVEQLLLSGVPVVMLDRKGDLARYADPTAWTVPEPDPERAARRDRLRSAIDVALFTPGSDRGRPLAIPVAPADLADLPTADREQIAQFAAASLGVMMAYKTRGPDPKAVILQKAIETLAAGRQAVTVKALQHLVSEQDPALVNQFDGQYGEKHFKALATDLVTLGLQHRRLLEGGPPLDVEALLGRGPHAVAGKTRLTVVSTQFLGDAGTVDFWVSQLLLAVERWRAKNPAPEGALQAALLFDEAEHYLPAVGKPATRGPIESLLRRGRSAGIGLLLATQSPGDFDYRCRDQVLTWFVGRVTQAVAIGKLKPMLEGRPGAADKLADQKAGEFYVVREAAVDPIRTDRNLIPTEQLPEDRVLEVARLIGPNR